MIKMPIPRERFMLGLQPYQHEVLYDFDAGINRFYMLEWPRRHRKTTLAINLLVREACRWPKTPWLYVAPTKVEAREIIWDDPNMLKESLPDKKEMEWKLNEQQMTAKFSNGSMIRFGGGDDPDSLRGPDYVGVVFDEWALHQERCWTEVLRPVIAGKPQHSGMRRWAMFIYTPKGINHATRMFDKACFGRVPSHGAAKECESLWFVSRMDAELVGFMSSEELALAKKDMPVEMYDQEFRCSRVTDEARCLITSSMIQTLLDQNWPARMAQRFSIKKIVAIDPAFGGDQCIVMGMEDGEILDIRSYAPSRTEEIFLEAKRMAADIGTKNFIGDCIGYGKGIMDNLAADEAGYCVESFNSAEASIDPMCINHRADAYYYAAGLVRRQQVAPIRNNELIRQLPIASRYEVRGQGRVQIKSKEIIRKDLGCSPDIADAYVYALWGLRNVEGIEVGKPHTNRNEMTHDRLIRMAV